VVAPQRHQLNLSPETQGRLELCDFTIGDFSDGCESDNPGPEMGHDPITSPADSFRPSDSPSSSPVTLQGKGRKLVLSDDSDSERNTQIDENADFGMQDDLQHPAPALPPKLPTPGRSPTSAVTVSASNLNGDKDRELFEAERHMWAEEFAKLTVERVRLETRARAAEKYTTEALDKERERWSQEKAKWAVDRTEWECERKKWSVERAMMIERREALTALMKTMLKVIGL
jgi:hypothetical protein